MRGKRKHPVLAFGLQIKFNLNFTIFVTHQKFDYHCS